MGLIAKDSGSFTLVPAGMHLARCYRIVDLGTQKSEYMGEAKYQEKAMLQFEIHGQDDGGNPLVTRDGRPLSMAKTYTVNLSDKSNLRKDLQMWRGRDFTAQELRGFELVNVLGVWAMLTVSHSLKHGTTYSNIASINPVPMTLKKNGLPEGVNELKVFRIANPDMELFDSFSENLKNRIKSSPEWQELHGAEPEQTPKDTSDHFKDFDNDLDSPPPF